MIQAISQVIPESEDVPCAPVSDPPLQCRKRRFTPARIETTSRTDDSEPAQGLDRRPDRIAPQVPQVREDDAWNEDQT